VALTGYIYFWYHGKDIGFPLALNTISGLVASACCYMITPILYNINHQLAVPLWIAFLFVCFSVLSAFIAAAFTSYAETHGILQVSQYILI
jgi:hypothetical protein